MPDAVEAQISELEAALADVERRRLVLCDEEHLLAARLRSERAALIESRGLLRKISWEVLTRDSGLDGGSLCLGSVTRDLDEQDELIRLAGLRHMEELPLGGGIFLELDDARLYMRGPAGNMATYVKEHRLRLDGLAARVQAAEGLVRALRMLEERGRGEP